MRRRGCSLGRFAYASIAGVLVPWLLGLAEVLMQSPSRGLLHLLGDWGIGAGLAALWWPGLLIVGFAIAARVRKRWPATVRWQPQKRRAADNDRISRVGWTLMTLFAIVGIALVAAPTVVLDLLYAGKAAPQAYHALSYDAAFHPMTPTH